MTRRSHRRPHVRLGLRARVTLAFALGAMILSAVLSLAAFALTRANLVRERDEVAQAQTISNADELRGRLPSLPLDQIVPVVQSLRRAQSADPLLYFGKRSMSISGLTEEAIPTELFETVVDDRQPASMRFRSGGSARYAVGIPIPVEDAAYFEIRDLRETEDALRQLSVSLIAAGVVTTFAGAGLGIWASRRTLRPLADVSHAAEAIAGGRLDTRLEADDDPDLGRLVASFNRMAEGLQERIERDARFASDVSHELRSPLMTVAAAVEVLEGRRGELAERSRAAVDLLSAEINRFQELVGDLLEISRFDAGAQTLELDDVRLDQTVMEAVRASGSPGTPVELDADLAGVVVLADKRRLMRVIANLLENADKYAGGATAVALRCGDDGTVTIAVEDEGPGVPDDLRARIFDRFARGSEARRRGTGDGVGLGLSLVAEHVRLLGGRVWVEDRNGDGPGARFVVELPVMEESR
ncbi:MAG: ATP-binding protein [Acidimicrobiales bacterium]